MIKIKKVKVTKTRKINIEYESYNNKVESWDEYSFTCADEPRPEFNRVLSGLSIHVADICELPNDYAERILIAGVTFSYGGENDTMGAVIVSQIELDNSNSNLNINTPHKISEYYGESGDPKQLLPDNCIRDLNELIEEAKLYINGERAQQNLFAAVN